MGSKSLLRPNITYLTLQDGKSNKFWEIRVEGATYTVRFGRIGSEGQTKTKDTGSAKTAHDDADKLVRSKERKGYVQVGSNRQKPKQRVSGHPIDQALLQKALLSLAPKIRSLPDSLSTDQCAEMFDGDTDNFDELLSPLGDEICFSWSFVRMWISYVALADANPHGYNKEKDVHFGDLHVRGDLDLTGNLSVLGNLRVDGAITQDSCEYAVLLVAGDLKARAFDVRGRSWVGGAFRGDYLQLSRWGFLYAADGVVADLVVRDAFESGIRCDFSAAHFIDTTVLEEEEILPHLSSVLVPAAMEDSDEYFDPDVTLALASKAKPFLKQCPGSMKRFTRIADEY